MMGGDFNVSNSTITYNTARAAAGSSMGGGVYLSGAAGQSIRFMNSTIAYNSSVDSGANISARSYRGTKTIINSIISNPLGTTSCFGILTSLGSNIDSDGSCLTDHVSDQVNIDPLLVTAIQKSIPTLVGLNTNSPAINAGNNSVCPQLDQKMRRRSDLNCDIGSIEYLAIAPSAGVIQFLPSQYSVSESDGFVDVVLERINGIEGDVSVDLLITDISTHSDASADYSLASALNRVQWLDGESGSKSVRISVVNDTVYEATESFRVELTHPVGVVELSATDYTKVVTIIDEDELINSLVRLEKSRLNVNENAGSIFVNVVRNESYPHHEVVADITLLSSTASLFKDYQINTDIIRMPAGVVRQALVIELVNDRLYEGTETINLQLTNPSVGTRLSTVQSKLSLTITDDELTPGGGSIGFASVASTLSEGQGSASIVVRRSGNTHGTVAVDYYVSGGTALNNSDFVLRAGTLKFSPGVSQQSISMTLIDDQLVEGVETILLSLSNVEGGASLNTTRTQLVTIVDNDKLMVKPGVVSFQFSQQVQSESAGLLNIDVIRSDGSDGIVSVDYQVVGGSATQLTDFIFASGTLIFKDKDVKKTLFLNIIDDLVEETDETVVLSLFNPQSKVTIGSIGNHTLIIQDNDLPSVVEKDVIQFDTNTLTINEFDGGTNLKITRTANQLTEAAFTLAVVGGTATFSVDYLVFEGILTFAAGEATILLPIEIFDDFDVEPTETIIFELSNVTTSTLSANSRLTINIVADDVAF